MTSELNCFVLGDDQNHLFTIEIPKNKNVSILKDLIKEKKAPHLNHVAASDLNIWKLSPPISSTETSTKLRDVQRPQQIPGSVKLNALDDISEHFSSAPRKHLHIIVEAPPTPSQARRRSPAHEDDPEAKRQKTAGVHLPTQYVLDNLNSFASAVWGNPQAVMKHDPATGADYIDLQGYTSALGFLYGTSNAQVSKILVREEYRTALHELETNECYNRGAYVTGQPGIGKSLFLIYALVERLGQQRTVAWQDQHCYGQYALFRNTVTIHSDRGSLVSYGPVLALSDSSIEVERPPPVFYTQSNLVQTIQATSPKRSRWKAWSKDAGAECYVMDIWSTAEIESLAKLMGLGNERMSFLAREWGGVPRTLLQLQKLTDETIKDRYKRLAHEAVAACPEIISSIIKKNLEEAPSQVFFCKPEGSGSRRMVPCAFVPTPTLCRLLGQALQQHNTNVKLSFFHALSQSNDTRAAAGCIYEMLFHNYFAAARPITCNWVKGPPESSDLTAEQKLIPSTLAALKEGTPPYFWVAPRNTPGIDSAYVLDDVVYVFQVTISPNHTSPLAGLQKLRSSLPNHLKDVSWRMVFIGNDAAVVKGVAEGFKNLSFPRAHPVIYVGWSNVDLLAANVTITMPPYEPVEGEEDGGLIQSNVAE